MQAQKITQEQLFLAVKDASKKGSSVRYGFILGAGASVASNIPSGFKLSSKWYKEIKETIGEESLKEWADTIEGFDAENIAASYTKIFKKRFEVDYHLGYQELQQYMDSATPSIGYSFLAQILDKTANKFVITTNFDTMTEDALFGLGNAKPLVLGHEVLSKFINAVSPTRPTIIKIHRDFLFDPYNTDENIQELDKQWQESLKPVLTENAMIILGYGGNDESLMNYLKQIDNRKPIYWCYREEKELSTTIKDLLGEKDFIIQITSFDKFMLLLNDKLEFDSFIDKEDIEKSAIVQNSRENAKNYIEQLEKLAKEQLNSNEQTAIKKFLPSWWDYQLAVNNEENIKKKNTLYKEGMKAHPKSHELTGNYALFLKDTIKEYDKAEKYYKQALSLDPDDANNNGNYANFLYRIKKEYNKAEEYYKKTLEIDQNHASYNGNYANFLHHIKKEYDKAEEYYKRALEIDQNHANNNGNYAQLLLIQGQKEQAQKYITKAFENHKEENDLLVELWFYRLAHYPEYFDEAQRELDRLLEAGHHSIAWIFDENIERAEKDGSNDIELLKRYTKRITEE